MFRVGPISITGQSMIDCQEGLKSEFLGVFFLKFLVVSCVLYGRIARLRLQAFAVGLWECVLV